MARTISDFKNILLLLLLAKKQQEKVNLNDFDKSDLIHRCYANLAYPRTLLVLIE